MCNESECARGCDLGADRSILRSVGYFVSAIAALAVVFELLFNAVGADLIRILAIGSGAYFAILFVCLLFNREMHIGIEKANRALQGDRTFQFKWIKFSDPEWGFFGRRAGSPSLLVLRALLFVEVFVAAFVFGVPSDGFFLAAGGFGIIMLLSLWHLARGALTVSS